MTGASADRAPDGNGWFNHPLTVRFHGSDATSDIDVCTVADYAGPNNPNASLAGSCRDRAGNPSGANAFAFKYDSAAPTVTKLTVKAGNRSAVLTWEASPDTSLVEIVRTAGARGAPIPVYKGAGRTFTDTGLANGVRYRYALTGYDEAHNAATAEAAATPNAPLVSPKAGAVVSSPPLLAWRAVPRRRTTTRRSGATAGSTARGPRAHPSSSGERGSTTAVATGSAQAATAGTSGRATESVPRRTSAA